MLFADRLAILLTIRPGVLGQIAYDQIKLIKIVSPQRFIAVTGGDSLMAQTAKHSFQYGTQFIVVVDDENPTFLHPTPICR
jgi:hypothetical protein